MTAAKDADAEARFRRLSLWFDTYPEPLRQRAPLPGDTDADVVIVGAGYTGLWTAYYLVEADPTIRVVVLEAETAGFGASGRNGGWCSALFPASFEKVARTAGGGSGGNAAARRMVDAMHATVDEVGRVNARERFDAQFVKGGTISLARTEVQLARARAAVAAWRTRGYGEDHYRLLDATETSARLGATRVLGGSYTPHCARIHPARLARGLADVVERRGVRIFENTRVTSIEPGAVRTVHGSVHAEQIVRATEGFTAELPGAHRDLAPVYSLMLATEPLPESAWESIGLRQRETFNDHRHLIIYGQRTKDGRLAFGGRGAPYHFGSTIRGRFDRDARVFTALRDVLVDLFPVVRDAAITHTWGGPLGIPRDWFSSVGLDRSTGVAWAGGYVGDGVGTSNLAGRTLADLIRGEPTDLTGLPWVGHRSPQWEPEPLRWIGVNGALRVMTSADAIEARTHRPARRAVLMQRLLGQ